MFVCPVCYFDKMPDPPQDFNICPCCGTEFGLDDELKSHTQIRYEWIMGGMKWFFRNPPALWSPTSQLERVSAPCIAPIRYLVEDGLTVYTGYNVYTEPLTVYNFASSYGETGQAVKVYNCFDVTSPTVFPSDDDDMERFDQMVTTRGKVLEDLAVAA